MKTAGELWPSRDEYDLAVARWAETIFDPQLRGGKLDYDHLSIRRYGGANLYVCVYRISEWMIRCFCSNHNRQPPADIRERYRAIAAFSQQNAVRIQALAPIEYFEQGIRVGTRALPLVKMPFYERCPSLGEFVLDHYTERDTMQAASDAWRRMIGELEEAQVAHGDLDLSNVLVDTRGPALALHLIDYDDMWLPSLAGRAQTEYGHQHFQHPAFMQPNPRPYAPDMDRFSALVIYISLRALVIQPELYEQWGADESERLLFSDVDYQYIDQPGNHIIRLRHVSPPDLLPCIDELIASLLGRRMPRALSALVPSPDVGSQLILEPRIIAPSANSPASAPISAPAPPRALWNQAKYNPQANFAFAAPPSPMPPPAYFHAGAPVGGYAPRPAAPQITPGGPSWAEHTGFNPSLPPLSRPQDAYRYNGSDVETRHPLWGRGNLAPLSAPGMNDQFVAPPQTPNPPAPVWNMPTASLAPSPFIPASVASTSPLPPQLPFAAASTDGASVSLLQAPPLAPSSSLWSADQISSMDNYPAHAFSPHTGDSPRPLDFAQNTGHSSFPVSRLLIWIITGILIALIAGAAVALALLLITGLHIGDMQMHEVALSSWMGAWPGIQRLWRRLRRSSSINLHDSDWEDASTVGAGMDAEAGLGRLRRPLPERQTWDMRAVQAPQPHLTAAPAPTVVRRVLVGAVVVLMAICALALLAQTLPAAASTSSPADPTPALSVSPGLLDPSNCALSGTTFTCGVTLSGSNIPDGGIQWQAISSVTVTPPSGTLTRIDSSTSITISNLPCSSTTITFQGFAHGKQVAPASAVWNCSPTPTPTPTPEPTPTPRPTPTPKPGITPTPGTTPTAGASPTSKPTAAPTPVPPTQQPSPTPTKSSSGMLGNLLGGTGSTPGGFPAGSALTIAALAVALLAFLLYLAGAPGTLPGKLLSLIIPASLTRRPPA